MTTATSRAANLDAFDSTRIEVQDVLKTAQDYLTSVQDQVRRSREQGEVYGADVAYLKSQAREAIAALYAAASQATYLLSDIDKLES